MLLNNTPTMLSGRRSLLDRAVETIAARLGRKSETFSELLGCPMTVGHVTGLVSASLLSGLALVAAAEGAGAGWALFLLSAAVQSALPGLRRFMKEGGEL